MMGIFSFQEACEAQTYSTRPAAGPVSAAHLSRNRAARPAPAVECCTMDSRCGTRKAGTGRDGVVRAHIVKIDLEKRLVFGWASVAVRKDGETVIDSQGDMLDPATLEAAAYRYILEDGDANQMHEDDRIGRPVESFV